MVNYRVAKAVAVAFAVIHRSQLLLKFLFLSTSEEIFVETEKKLQVNLRLPL